MRAILIVLILLVFAILSIIALPLAWLIGKVNPHAKQIFSYHFVTKTLLLIRLASGVKLEIRGKENIPQGHSVLFVANHRSYFDVIINYSLLPPLMGFIAKIELKKVPILAQWMENMNCLFLDRSNIKEGLKMMKSGVEMLQNGISIFIFPEGTRTKSDDAMEEFKGGSLKMAEKANVPIVPIAINNTSALFEDHFPFVRKAHVIIEYCEPIILDELSKEDKKFLSTKVETIIREKVMQNKNDL